MRKLGIILFYIVFAFNFPLAQTHSLSSTFSFNDMFKIRKVRSPRLSPDGQFSVFEVAEADSHANKWITHLWRTDILSHETIQLTRGDNNETDPRWSPDGQSIVFLSDKGEHRNLFKISNSGGEAHSMFLHPANITDFQISNDGEQIFFMSADSLSAEEKSRKMEKNDAYYFDENNKAVQLWSYRIASGFKQQLTRGEFSINEFRISPDNHQVAFVAAPSPRRDDYLKREIYILNLDQRTVKQLTHNKIGEQQIRWSPEGPYLSFVSDANSQEESYYQESIFLLDLNTGMVVDLLPDFDFQVMEYFWTSKGRDVYFIANTGVNTQFFRLNRKAGGVAQVTSDDHDLRGIDYNPALDRLVYLESTPVRPYDLLYANPSKLPGEQITSMNGWLVSRPLAAYQTIHWTSTDGHVVEGLLILPAGQPQKPYPLIVQLHGGPESSYRNYFGSSWATYPQVWAAHGYAVFQPNYRGSTGYGNEVMRAIIGHYFEKDIDDIISGVDNLVDQGIADPAEMAVMGWSAGGHLTNWLITHFQRFKAACSGAGGANWYSFYAQTDMQYIREIWHLGPPYENQDYYMKKSPVTYVRQAKTPTLILCGEEDRRVPFAQSLEMYRGLKRYGCPVQFVAFPREGHSVRELKHQGYKMRVEFQWVEKHLFNRDWELGDLK